MQAPWGGAGDTAGLGTQEEGSGGPTWGCLPGSGRWGGESPMAFTCTTPGVGPPCPQGALGPVLSDGSACSRRIYVPTAHTQIRFSIQWFESDTSKPDIIQKFYFSSVAT